MMAVMIIMTTKSFVPLLNCNQLITFKQFLVAEYKLTTELHHLFVLDQFKFGLKGSTLLDVYDNVPVISSRPRIYSFDYFIGRIYSFIIACLLGQTVATLI